MLILSAPGCGAQRPAAEQRGLSDWLAECSPFNTYVVGQKLTFDYNGRVDLDGGGDKGEPVRLTGQWSGPEEGNALEIDLPSRAPIHQVLQLPAGGSACLLTTSASPVVDLRTAWLGILRKPDGEDDDDP